jgi:hypothetical protein
MNSGVYVESKSTIAVVAAAGAGGVGLNAARDSGQGWLEHNLE